MNVVERAQRSETLSNPGQKPIKEAMKRRRSKRKVVDEVFSEIPLLEMFVAGQDISSYDDEGQTDIIQDITQSLPTVDHPTFHVSPVTGDDQATHGDEEITDDESQGGQGVDASTGEGSGRRIAKNLNHSEIEKRRRDRMNCSIKQLASYLPGMADKKLDKLSVLRQTLMIIKAARVDKKLFEEKCTQSASTSSSDLCTDAGDIDIMLRMIRKDHPTCILIMSSVNGKIHNVYDDCELFSASSSWKGHNIIDILHPDDLEPFKQLILTPSDGEKIDTYGTSTTSAVSSSTVIDEDFEPENRRWITVRLRDGSKTVKVNFHGIHRPSTRTCLFLLSKRSNLPPHQMPARFDFKISPYGRIIDADANTEQALGFTPHELESKSYYELIHEGDLLSASHTQRKASQSDGGKAFSCSYRMRTDHGERFLQVEAIWMKISNPLSNEHLFYTVTHYTKSVSEEEEKSAQESTLRQLLRNDNPSAASPRRPSSSAHTRSSSDMMSPSSSIPPSWSYTDLIPPVLGVERLGIPDVSPPQRNRNSVLKSPRRPHPNSSQGFFENVGLSLSASSMSATALAPEYHLPLSSAISDTPQMVAGQIPPVIQPLPAPTLPPLSISMDRRSTSLEPCMTSPAQHLGQR